MHPTARNALIATLAATALLALLPWLMPAQQVAVIASEEGPLEMLSAVLWLAMGVIALARVRPLSRTAVAYALTGLVLAVREMGIPRWLVPSGSRLLKAAYYRDAGVPLPERVATGIVIAVLLAAIIWALVATARHLFLRGGWRQASGQLLILAGATLVASQVCERGGSLLPRLGLPPGGEQVLAAWLALEEGLECITGVLACMGVWLAAQWKRQARIRAARERASPVRGSAAAGSVGSLF